MLKRITHILTFTALVMGSTSALALDSSKKALIHELLEQTGQSNSAVMKQMSDFYLVSVTELMKKTSPNIDSKILDVMREAVEEVVTEEIGKKNALNNLIYPIYDKYLTKEDLKALIEFNKSPAGKKVNRVTPKIQQEAMTAGAQLGRTLGPKFQSRLQQKLKEKNLTIQ